MSFNQPARTRQQSAMLAALPGSSVSPSRHSEDEEFVQLNQGQFGSQGNDDESGPSAFVNNPTFDLSTVADSFNTIALQQKLQQQKNHQLYQLLAKLTEKIDDLTTRNDNGASANNGEENSSPSHEGEGDDVTTGDKSEYDDEEDESDSEEVGE